MLIFISSSAADCAVRATLGFVAGYLNASGLHWGQKKVERRFRGELAQLEQFRRSGCDARTQEVALIRVKSMLDLVRFEANVVQEIARTPRMVRFGAFEVDLRAGELSKNGAKLKLTGQPFQVLTILLEQPGEVVTREELQKRLWPDTFVDADHNINTAVNKIREALGDSAESPCFVETLPRRGYRFIGPVEGSSHVLANPAAAETNVVSASTANRTPRKYPNRPKILGYCIAGLLTLIAISVSWILHKAPPPYQRALTRLTFDDGLQFGASWSPDGRFIAYCSDRGGKLDIWVKQVSGGDPVQITKGEGNNWQPDWSPDGKYIAYRSEAGDGGLYIVPALGGAGLERRIAAFGYHPRWSPDSSKILFQTHFTWLDANDKFYIAQLDGSQPHEILTQSLAERDLWPASAMWHPDGKRVTVWVGRTGRYSERSPTFWTIPVSGGVAIKSEIAPAIEEQLKDVAVTDVMGEWPVDFTFAWAPDGKAIYFERAYRGTRNIWKLLMDPDTLKAIGIERLTTGAGPDTEAAVSRDGMRLAFTAKSEHVRAWIFPFEASHSRLSGRGEPITSSGGRAVGPNLSPDGKKLVFGIERTGTWEMWQKSLVDGHEAPIITDEYVRQSPQWSPDGTRLAYQRERPGERQLMLWSAKNRTEEPLTTSDVIGWQLVHDWSPDGKALLVSRAASDETQPFEVWLIPIAAAPHAETAARRIISSPTCNLFQAHFSPDGRWITFQATTDTATGIDAVLYVTSAAGGPWIRLGQGKHWNDKPRWSPDGKTIYFLSGRSGFFNVWGVHFNPAQGTPVGSPFAVTAFDKPSWMISQRIEGAELSVTQHRLSLLMEETSGSIWVLDNVER
jgi:Tol biopolymer transport system component/DNA-binding winged helix-turn-helix (wHTH) protein